MKQLKETDKFPTLSVKEGGSKRDLYDSKTRKRREGEVKKGNTSE